MKQIMINNIRIDFERKRIKNMYLRIQPPDGRIQVSAPLRMSEAEIQSFIKTKLDWIEKQQEKIRKRNIHAKFEFKDGEEIPVWGRSYSLLVKETKTRSRCYLDGENFMIEVKTGSSMERCAGLLDRWYKDTLEKEIPGLINQWEKIIGVKADDWTTRDMKTRWGTCNVKTGKICLNLQLAKKPPKCLEYVVIHELVHLLERSHNHVFKSYMDRFLPQWRNIKKELNGIV